MPPTIRSGFEDLDEISGTDGVTAIISRRRSNGRLAIALFKTFERDGEKERTAFWSSHHLDNVRKVLDQVEIRVREIEAGAR